MVDLLELELFVSLKVGVADGFLEQAELGIPYIEIEEGGGTTSARGFGVVGLILGEQVATRVGRQEDFATVHSFAPKLVLSTFRVPFLLGGVEWEGLVALFERGALICGRTFRSGWAETLVWGALAWLGLAK